MILTHYESGCRIGGTLSLCIKHVTFDKHGAVLMVDGKTGPRRVRIIASAPALASWLSMHPLRNDLNAPLWIGIGTVGRYDALLYNGARAMLRRLVKKSRFAEASLHASYEALKGNRTGKHSKRSTNEGTSRLGSRLR